MYGFTSTTGELDGVPMVLEHRLEIAEQASLALGVVTHYSIGKKVAVASVTCSLKVVFLIYAVKTPGQKIYEDLKLPTISKRSDQEATPVRKCFGGGQ